MRNHTMIVRGLIVAVLTVLGALALAPAAQAGVPTADKLTLTWAADGKQLQVDGIGYRPKGTVGIALGDSPVRKVRADDAGHVRVSVPEQFVTAGHSGTSIVVTGRSVSGASRVLISAVPPRAAVRGPADVLPWTIGAAVAGIIVIGALLRLRSRRS